jgi:hypothetical protein
MQEIVFSNFCPTKHQNELMEQTLLQFGNGNNVLILIANNL